MIWCSDKKFLPNPRVQNFMCLAIIFISLVYFEDFKKHFEAMFQLYSCAYGDHLLKKIYLLLTGHSTLKNILHVHRPSKF